jgi:methionyl aminopeptidase
MTNEAAAKQSVKCANPECDKESGKLVCPTCQSNKTALNVSSFCSQECFKTFWPIHKLTHSFPKAADEKEKAKAKA